MHIIEVDFVGQVLVNGHHLGVRLTRKEAELLRAIMTHSHVATKEFILSSLYGGMDEPELQIIAVFVTKLRKKLGPHRDAILTAWGRGFYRNKDYRLKAPETQQVTVSVEASKLEQLCMATGESPDTLMQRLLVDETRRTYSDAA
jgi:hypothetical protein